MSGHVHVEVANRQAVAPVAAHAVKALVAYCLCRSRPGFAPRSWGEVSVVLVDDRRMATLNARWLGHGETTDVLSLCYDPLPGQTTRDGELIVNVERAAQARRYGWGFARELALYIAHGCDHLGGADDADPDQRRRMRRRELRWLRQARQLGLVDALSAASGGGRRRGRRHGRARSTT
jgi:rRNA maturation RNase YbeY